SANSAADRGRARARDTSTWTNTWLVSVTHDLIHDSLDARAERAAHHGVPALHHRLEPALRDEGRIFFRSGLGEVGALEEVGVGRAGLQHGDGDAGVFELLAKGLTERHHEYLRGAVDGLERARLRREDRAGEEHAAAAAVDHRWHEGLRDVD